MCAVAAVAVMLTLQTLSVNAADMFVDHMLPREGEPFKIVYRPDKDFLEKEVKITVRDAGENVLEERVLQLHTVDESLQGELELTVATNGMLRAKVVAGQSTVHLDIPVISAKRDVNLIYFAMSEDYFDSIRWVTLVTSAPPGLLKTLRERGIKGLAYNWGSNYLQGKGKELGKSGIKMSPELARELSRGLYSSKAGDVVAKGFSGYGMDEFGGYAASESAAYAKGYVRGIIDARKEMPDDFIMAAWHSGPIDTEMMGLYKQAVEFLLPEAYLLECVPREMGTELIQKDMEGRLQDARANDMLTAPYNTRCKVIPAVDVTDSIPLGEYENFIRMMRREFPEVRGIAFFNVLKAEIDRYKVIDALCFDYFIKPVVTFQPDSLYYDTYGSGTVKAFISNIGSIDGGKVTVRLLVDGKEVERTTVPGVPAGYSRLDNRAAATFKWQPRNTATYRLRVEIVDAADSTVLDPTLEATVFLREETGDHSDKR